MLESLNLHSSANRVKNLMPQLPKYEEISCDFPSTSRVPVEHTSLHKATVMYYYKKLFLKNFVVI